MGRGVVGRGVDYLLMDWMYFVKDEGEDWEFWGVDLSC